MESARRASEIHKRRTGRSLRVTEQDVINEEMYEEEDDDVPLQYRLLTAHLQTNSVDFNRRLAAYLTNQVAMRSAMEQMVHNSYGQPYPNMSNFATQIHPPMYPPYMAHQSMPPTPTSAYRPAPYPSPHQPGFRQMHGRSYSIASPNDVPNFPTSPTNPGPSTLSLDHRRMSTPANLLTTGPMQPLETENVKPDPEYQRQTQSAITTTSAFLPATYPQPWPTMGPFTTALPPESQQLLGPGLDPTNPFTSVLMAGSENYISSPYYPWGNMQSYDKVDQQTSPMKPSYDGMSATLAPSALDVTTDSHSVASAKAEPTNEISGSPSAGLDFNSSQEGNSKEIGGPSSSGLTREDSGQSISSGQITPGEGFWDSFVQDGSWTDDGNVT